MSYMKQLARAWRSHAGDMYTASTRHTNKQKHIFSCGNTVTQSCTHTPQCTYSRILAHRANSGWVAGWLAGWVAGCVLNVVETVLQVLAGFLENRSVFQMKPKLKTYQFQLQFEIGNSFFLCFSRSRHVKLAVIVNMQVLFRCSRFVRLLDDVTFKCLKGFERC